MNDASILQALRSRDDDAGLQAVYRQYRESCLRFLLTCVIPPHYPNREDVAVELFTESLIILTRNVRTGKLTTLPPIAGRAPPPRRMPTG